MRCMPFSEALYRTLQHSGLDAESMWNNRERFSRGQRWPASPDGLEDELRWLIAVGVLRREVDGQGLTERVRLTPLGRVVLSEWSGEIPCASLPSRLRHWVKQHWPRL